MEPKVLIERFQGGKQKDIRMLDDALSLCKYQDNHKDTVRIREIARGLMASGSRDAYDLFWRSVLLDAKVDFDCFMLYNEHKRPAEQQYWLPRRDKLLSLCKALQDMEDGKLDELFLAMPPRTGKTTLMVMFTLWVMLRNSERSNLYCSFSDGVVKTFYKGIIEMLSDKYTYAWNEIFPTSEVKSTDSKDFLINLDRNKRYASFTGRSIYGTLNGACDCSGYQIADDVVSGIEEALSVERLNSLWQKVENNYLTRAKAGARRLWIGTRWSVRDVQARRIELLRNDVRFRSIRWREINVPALNEKGESNFDYLYDVGYPTKTYLQVRASFEHNSDMASWLAQFQGEPVERAGTLFSPDDLRYYNGVFPEAEPDRIFMAVDPAWGGGDYTAAPVCYQYGDDLYVADVVYDNGDKRNTQPLIANAVKKHGVQAVFVEATKTTASYTEGVDQLLRQQGIKINIRSSISHYTGTGKQQRIYDKAPDIRDKMVFLADGYRNKAYSQFMANVYAFTVSGKTKHDDAPDSLAMAINMAFFAVSSKVEIIRKPF